MRRVSFALAGLVAVLGFVVGCSRQESAKAEKPGPIAPVALEVGKPEIIQVAQNPFAPPVQLPQQGTKEAEENFEASLTEALKFLADGKLNDALVALETAQTFQDSEFVRGEIEKLKNRLDQDTAAQKTVTDLETVLEQGQVEDATQLARDALKEFGGSDAALRLVQLRMQAEALHSVQKPEDPQGRFQRFRLEAEGALKEKNLRAAALALDQALQSKEDEQLRAQLDEVRTALQKYDSLRGKAAQLRRDPGQVEDALAMLQEAAEAWDTWQVRQEIDECNVALQKRRPRVSVADFEVRGETGIPEAGAALAEELLPHLKAKFDLVERDQIGKILEELKLENELTQDLNSQRELGRLAKVQYLVVGSVNRLGGITVQARLVDVRSGLIVQTAKVTAATPEEIVPLMGALGKQLLMTDEEKMVYDQEIVREARRPVPPAADAPLPPPPQIPGVDVPPPPPEISYTEVPPEFGGLRVEDFKRLPAPPPPGQFQPQPLPGGVAEARIKNRLLHTVLQLGDNQYRRGNPAAAHRYFNLALNLSPSNFDIRLRLANTQPLLPPPPVVVVNPPPVVVRPRIAVLNFAVFGNPAAVPPSLGTWTPQHLSPYLLSEYEIADPGEVYWYMGRMGLTLKDLMEDPYARRWLGRALNVRHFLLGTIVETASFDVNTYLIDAEYGFLHGQGSVHVRHPLELKLRLSELAFLTLMDPGERARYHGEAQRFQALVLQGQQSMDRRAYPDAITAFEGALRIRPGNTEVQVYLGRARSLHQQYLWEEARRQEFLRQQAFAAERARRQWELAQAAEAARLRAAQGGIFLAVDLRQRAQSDLVTQARLALKVGNFSLSISKFQSAVALSPNDDLYRELALARAQAARNAELAAAQAQAQREANLRKQREKEYFQARQTIAHNHLFTQTALEGQHKTQQERDQRAYQSAFDEGQRMLAKGDYDGAITNLQAARRMKKTEAVEALLAHAMVEQAKASAQAKGDLERQELERRLALERQRRLQAEAEAKRNQELYQAALLLAQKALAEKNYEVAQAKYEEAGKFFKTDVVLTGLRKTRDLRQKHQEKNVEDQERSARLQKYLLEGQVALEAKKYDAAVQAYAQARKLAPDNVDALTGLTKAEQLRDQAFDVARRQAEEFTRQKNFQRLLKTGQDNLANKNYDAAVLALTEAVKLNPKDPTASAALQTAVKARGGDTKNQEEFKKKAFVYHKHLGEGKNALASKRYDEAIQAFAAAQKVLPGDKTSAEFLQEAQKAKQDQTAAITLAAKKKAEDLQRTLEVQKALKKGQTALAGKNLEEADQAIAMAVQLAPDDPAVLRAQRDLQAARKLAQAQAELQNKRAQQHQALMVFAQKELAAGRFEEAIKALTDANTLVPDNKTSQDLLRQAQKAQAEARALEEKALALKSQLERTERVKKHLVDTQVALKVKDFNVAAKHLAEARKLAPQDPAVLQAQRDLDTARQATLGAEKKLAAYQEAMAEGQKALNAKQFAGAVKAFTEATQLLPGDAKAGLLLKQAEQAWYDAKASSADLAKRQVNYQQALTQGQKALNAKQYPEAIKAFTEAGKWMPGDQKASQLLAQAQQGLNQSKKTPEEEPKKKVDPPTKKPAVGDPRAQYQKEMEQAETLEKQGKLAEAIQNYREALKLAPKDDKATTGLRRASFNLHLKEGQEDLNAGRYKAAIAHFEAALDIFPNNPAAQKLLARAKQGKK